MDVKDASLYKRTQKKEYNISCEVPKLGTAVHNVLELSDYVTDAEHPVVLTGTVGEQWVVSVGKLKKTYTKVDGTLITDEDIADAKASGKPMTIRTLPGVPSFAMFVPVSMNPTVRTSWGDTLTANVEGVEHGEGDYIVCIDKDGAPDFDDMWVVNGLVFETTYTPIR